MQPQEATYSELQSPNPLVRREAVVQLRAHPTDDAREALIAALQDASPAVRREAAQGLALIGQAHDVEKICDALADEDMQVRGWLIEALDRIGDDRAVGSLTRLLGDSSSRIRLRAVGALSQFHQARVVAPLCRALADEDSEVRAAAESALVAMGRLSAALLCRALGDPEPGVRDLAMEALVKIGTAILPDVVAVMGADSVEIRRRAVLTIAAVGADDGSPALLGACEDPHWSVRQAAVSVLASSGDRAAAFTVARALEDTDARVRLRAVQGLSGHPILPIEGGIEKLCNCLFDSDEQVRLAAKQAVYRLGSAALPVLQPWLKKSESQDRRAVAEMLGEIGDAASLRVLQDRLRFWRGERDRAVREAVRHAIDRIEQGANSAR